MTIVPTHALELVEAAAARWAVEERRIEGREMPEKPLDVLVQHLVTVAIGGGFGARELYDEVRSTYAYRRPDAAGVRLGARRSSKAAARRSRRIPTTTAWCAEDDGVYRVPREDLVRRHRNNVGTIVANAHRQCRLS